MPYAHRFTVYFDPTIHCIQDFVPAGCRLNDGRVDPEGCFVVSGTVEKGEEPLAAVYRNLEQPVGGHSDRMENHGKMVV